MLKKLVIFLIIISTLQSYSQDIKKNTAKVEQINGLYVFTDAKPIKEYDYIGSENSNVNLGYSSSQYTAVRDQLIRKVKKKYPNAQGVILHLNYQAKDVADAIKFVDTSQCNYAEVEQIQGLYIFTDCFPIKEYTVVDNNISNVWGTDNNQYQGVRDGLIKKVKKNKYDANAIILHLKDGGTDKADVLKIE